MIRIGLVGLGFIANTHLEAYKHIDNAIVSMICTRDKKSGLKAASENNCIYVEDFDELLANEEIDVIDICLPTFLHEEFILKALEMKKHVICEKPLTLTIESTNRILDKAKSSGVDLFVGQVLRFWPEYQTVKEYYNEGKLGNINVVYANRLSQVPKWSEWFKDSNKSGGALFDLHLHDIDFLYYLLGEFKSVYAVGKQNEYGAWDQIMTTICFGNGSKAYVEASHRMPKAYPFTMSLRVQGDLGTLDFSTITGENIENIKQGQEQFKFYEERGKSYQVDYQKGDPFINELTYFMNCIQNKGMNDVIPLSDVKYIMKLMNSIEKSLDQGRVVNILDDIKELGN